jgi:phenylpyruvate tautomerase PptA (4-oxalocrotonate tautomerase family)
MKVLIEREEAAQIAREIIKEITNHVLEQTSEDKEKR